MHRSALRITNLQKAGRALPPQQLTVAPPAGVQLRVKSASSAGERLSQSKSMVLQDSDLPQKPVSKHHLKHPNTLTPWTCVKTTQVRAALLR